MATRELTGGLDHPTVVPENFEPDDEESADEDGSGDGDATDRA